MATVKAVKNGNWSDPTVWSTGALPQTGDDVYANTFTVQCDTTARVVTLTNIASTGITAGGTFNLLAGTTLTATNIVPSSANTPSTITCSVVAPNSATLVGDFTIGVGSWAPGCVTFTGTGTLNVVGTIYGRTSYWSNVNDFGLYVNGAGTVNFTGAISVTRISDGPNCCRPIIINSAGATVNITLSSGTFSSGVYAQIKPMIEAVAAATINITGQASAGEYCPVFSSAVAHKLTHVGTFTPYGSPSGGTVLTTGVVPLQSSHANGVNILSGPFVCSSNGTMPFAAYKVFLAPTLNNSFKFYQYGGGAGGAATYLYSPDTYADAPAPANVRSGVTYATGLYTGTMAVPAYGDVAKNVQVGAGVGEAVFDPAAVWEVQTSALTTSGSIGERLKNAATVDSTGAQIAALK